MIDELISAAVIVASVEATEKEDLFPELLRKAADEGAIDAKQRAPLLRKLREREGSGSTGIGNGVAVPHVKSKSVTGVQLVVGRSVDGIPYQAVDGRVVHTVFLVFADESAPEAHLSVLRWISQLARNPDFRRFFVSAESTDAIRELLQEMTA